MLATQSSKPRRSKNVARDLVAEYRRTAILDAARTVFARHGFAASSMESVAHEADVAKGTLYLYYRSKAALYRAAVSSGLERLTAETIELLDSGRPFVELLSEFFGMRERYFADQHDFLRIYGAEMAALGTAAQQIRRDVVRLQGLQIEALRRALEAAVHLGAVRGIDSRAAAQAIFDLSHGSIMRRIRHGQDREAADTTTIVDLLWRGLAK